jgi:hypothetical protein
MSSNFKRLQKIRNQAYAENFSCLSISKTGESPSLSIFVFPIGIFKILINPLKNGYLEVMNDIIGELEADHEAAVNAAEAAAAGKSGSEMKTESRNSR